MNPRIDYSQLDQAFKEALDHKAALYVTIGMRIEESPMWFQFTRFDDDFKQLVFVSSQCSLNFAIDYPEGWPAPNYGECYEHFRAVKYQHLHDKWPKIYGELRALHPKPIAQPEEKPKTDVIGVGKTTALGYLVNKIMNKV